MGLQNYSFENLKVKGSEGPIFPPLGGCDT
jgi:hypothetical protein